LNSFGNPGSSIVIERQDAFACPWFKIIRKRVRPGGQRVAFDHFSVAQQDYVSVLAVTRAGSIPVVRQYRPAVETYSLEFPAGLLELGETPESAARRELTEETGLHATDIVEVGSTFADTGRLNSRFHAFFAIAEDSESAVAEPGLDLRYFSIDELRGLILSNGFVLQTHIGVLYAAAINPKVCDMLARIGLPGLLLR
jgi:ADP-ribose pyrophosphatase